MERDFKMKKQDLKTSDVVLSTKGSYGVVLRDTPKGSLIKWFFNKNRQVIHKFRSLDMLNDDMSFRFDPDNRIIKVFRITDQHDMTTMNAMDEKYLIWKEEVKELTIADIEKKYGCKVKIVKEK